MIQPYGTECQHWLLLLGISIGLSENFLVGIAERTENKRVIDRMRYITW